MENCSSLYTNRQWFQHMVLSADNNSARMEVWNVALCKSKLTRVCVSEHTVTIRKCCVTEGHKRLGTGVRDRLFTACVLYLLSFISSAKNK